MTSIRLSSVALALVMSAACSAPSNHSVAPAARTAAHQRVPRKQRVLLSDFELEPASPSAASTIALNAAARCARIWSLDGRMVCVAPIDVEGAPFNFRQGLFDYVLEGTLAREGEVVNRIDLRAVSARSGHEIAHVSSPCAPTHIEHGTLDAAVLDSLAGRIADAIAQRPWSTAVLDKAERVLIIGGGPETGLALGEELVVRKLQAGEFERGIESWLEVPSVEVARIEVEVFVGAAGTFRGAQCRLKSGSFGGFEIDQLVVTAP